MSLIACRIMLVNAYDTEFLVEKAVNSAVNGCGDSDFFLILAIKSLVFLQK